MTERYDLVVVGGGPSGHKAAVQAAKVGKRVLLVNKEAGVGGECLFRGTIPSKTLRETAVYLKGLRTRSEGVLEIEVPVGLKVASLMRRLRTVLDSEERCLRDQLDRNGIEYRRGRARFVSPEQIEILHVTGKTSHVRADHFVIATGSRPRRPPEIPIDHEYILDSDSILSLLYLPESMVVLGGGVIACEFATVFASLGVRVTIVDRHDRPLGFLDETLTDQFVESLEALGGRFIPGGKTSSVLFDGISGVTTELESGEVLRTEKLLCALGRQANVGPLAVEQAGLTVTERGFIEVDEHCRTSVPHIYAVGDVIGPPALAATAAEQGRRAARHFCNLPGDERTECVPVGIYTIPEMASVGLTEAQAKERFGSCHVGIASFGETARGLINGNTEGLLKLVSDASGEKLVGAHILGEGATDLVHVAQMAIYAGLGVDVFIENIFNYPTLAEAYRAAALDLVSRRGQLSRAA